MSYPPQASIQYGRMYSCAGEKNTSSGCCHLDKEELAEKGENYLPRRKRLG